jgi:hypothetical protein
MELDREWILTATDSPEKLFEDLLVLDSSHDVSIVIITSAPLNSDLVELD